MNKTLYIRDDEAPIWDRARELAADRLSPVIVEALKQFVAGKEAQAKGFERIVLNYEDSEDHELPRAKAFYGKWIIPPNACFKEDGASGKACFAVAVTAKGGGVVYSWSVARDGRESDKRLHIYPSLDAAARNPDENRAVLAAIQKQGVPIEELDI